MYVDNVWREGLLVFVDEENFALVGLVTKELVLEFEVLSVLVGLAVEELVLGFEVLLACVDDDDYMLE